MKILITGGAGYLGSVLTQELVELGNRVTVLDTFEHGVPSLIGHLGRVQIERYCIRDSNALRICVANVDAVVHLAALVGAPMCDQRPHDAEAVNEGGVLSVLRSLRRDQMLVYPCTNSGYGRAGERPVTEDDPMTPISLYGRTKVRGEALALKHPRAASLRFATLYGASPRMRLDLLVNDFAYTACRTQKLELFEPHFRRCVLHVRDAARAIIAVLARSRTGDVHGAWNVGAENVTKRQLADLIGQKFMARWRAPVGITEREGQDPDQRDYAVSSEAFRRSFFWAPQVNLDAGLDELFELFRMPFDGGAPRWRNA